ncbi:heme lyase CcmF/NrfE family subunit [Permianibacter sp. IMCC34836]|uniref:heme lyase CcmF/NrfE family subunit n=1 Tax=Permianibacter fluminis TaxID=2738515 RepID=UPI0015566EFB|nr:heme lyase CcmF/NrfE family subunit [Permianibacter fluminis]NQD38215.1 heme lyase CcmF/NrfE family subunit [Permianibacter fluminis]
MIPELGHFALILALLVALVQAVVPMVGSYRGDVGWMQVAKPAATVQFLLLVLSFSCLAYAFASNDFTVHYVASNSNSQLPIYYRLSAVWGAHEGSLLLWALVLSGWTYAVARRSAQLPIVLSARVLSIMGIVAVGFLSFMIFTSNPFVRTLPMFPVEGRDLNPLLQDFGLIVHPPMLYMGYVGFSVAFAFAIAALLGGKLDSAWARWSRPWTTAAWIFLTAGITLGSWWAYYELGWGGWWFWDPVENASFMPWLAGTALIHSLAVTEKRDGFKAWTVLLAIFAFSLSLLGTFLVRSGVLTSVHAFASDPERGLFILAFLAVVIGGSLLLFALRATDIRSATDYQWLSREVALLGNNILLSVIALMVLIGTLQPLIVDALNLGKISVGPPYFNFMFCLFAVPLLVLIGVGPQLRWRSDDGRALLRTLLPWLLASLALAFVLSQLLAAFSLSALAAIALALWVLSSLLRDLWQRLRNRQAKLASIGQQPRAWWGMVLAHAGMAVVTIGVTLSTVYSVERDIRLAPGDHVEVGPYQFHFMRLRDLDGPNYHSTRALFEVRQDNEVVARLRPEKRVYAASRQSMTEAAIDPGLTRDLYVAMGEPLEGNAWAIRVYYKPFVRWIWLGGVLMAMGGVLAATDRRYRVAVAQRKAVVAADGAQA